MKKFCIGLLTCILLVTPTFAKTETLSINGKDMSIDVQQISGRTLIPLRKLADAFDLNTTFYANDETIGKNAIVVNDPVNAGDTMNVFVRMNVDSKKAIVQSKEVTLDVAPKLMNGSVYVPLRFICEAFNGTIDLVNGKIHVTTNKGINHNTTTSTNKISSTEMKKVGVNFITINNEKVASLWNSAVYYEIGSNIIDIKYMLGERTTVKLSDKVESINGVTLFPKDVMNYLYVEDENIEAALKAHGVNYNDVKDYWSKGNITNNTNNNNNNGSNQHSGNTALKQSDYICDSNVLKPFVEASSEMNQQLLKQKGYGYSAYLEAANKLNEWAKILSTQTVFTPEGKALKEATINEMKVIGKGFSNLYNGKNIDYDALVDVETKSYNAVRNFRIALQNMGL